MKKLIAGIAGGLFLHTSIAQKLEFSMGVDGTASFFRGANAGSNAFILLSDVPGPATPDVTVFPYSKKPDFGGAVNAGMQKTGKKGFIAGLSGGYDLLISQVKIMQVEGRFGFTPANGKSKLTHTFINLFPYIGKRFGGNNSMKCVVDVNLGLDAGITLTAHEKGETQINGGSTIITNKDQRKPSVDFRPRLQVRLQKKHAGLQSSYSHGLTNYFGYSTLKAFSNVFRFGVFYVL